MLRIGRSFATLVTSERPFKVLFCGHEFTNGFLFTKQELARRFPNVITEQCSRENLHKEIETADVVVPFMCKIGPKEFSIGQNIKMVMQFGIGLEGVDVPAASRAGVHVCNIPSEGTGNAQSCAEHALFLALSLLRNVQGMNQSLLLGQLGTPMGRTLYRSTAIIYGFGGIGKQLLQRLRAFDMEIIVVSRSLPTEAHGSSTGSSTVTYITTAEWERRSYSAPIDRADLLFLCCSQNADNLNLVNKDFLSRLKNGVFIVNVARGGLLNYEDVYEGLCDGSVGGVGMDVYHTEPFPYKTRYNNCDSFRAEISCNYGGNVNNKNSENMENMEKMGKSENIEKNENAMLLHPAVVVTPHVAGVTEVSYRNMAEKVADNVERIMNGQVPSGCVNHI